MHADEFDHIRADVQQAIIEASQHDPTVTTEILFRLLDQVGAAAQNIHGDPWPLMQSDVQHWATGLLRDVQLRAVSKVPYGEPQPDEPPEDHRD